MTTAVRIERAAFYRNPFIGLFLKCNDKIGIAPPNTPTKITSSMESVLGVKVIRALINQSPLVGLYTVMNSRGALLPEFATTHDRHVFEEHGLKTFSVPSSFAAVSNNVLANDKAALLNPNIPPHVERMIADALGVETHRATIGHINTVGAINVVTNNGLLAYNEAADKEIEMMESLFGVKGARATANLGVPFNNLNVVANSKGALVGDETTGPEIARIYEALST